MKYCDSCFKFLIFYIIITYAFKLSPSFIVSKGFDNCNSIWTHYNKLFKGNKPNTRFRCFLNSAEFSVIERHHIVEVFGWYDSHLIFLGKIMLFP